MRNHCLFAAIISLCLSGQAFAAAEVHDKPSVIPKKLDAPEPADEMPNMDGVEEMKASYVKHFPELPPTRNCLPQDAQGLWVQKSILQNPKGDATQIFANEGPEYLWFSTYNRFVRQRAMRPISAEAMEKIAGDNLQQYIVSVKGVLYIYEGYALKSAMLCFVVSETTDKFKEGMLLLAVPAMEGKSLAASFYAPAAWEPNRDK